MSVTAVLFPVCCLSSYSLMYWSLQYTDVQLQLSDYACHHTISWFKLWWVSGFLHHVVLACVDLSCGRTGSQLLQHPAEPGLVILKMEAKCSSETPGTNHYHMGGGVNSPKRPTIIWKTVAMKPWTCIIAIIIAILLWCCYHYFRRVVFPFVVLFSLSRCCFPSFCGVVLITFVVLLFHSCCSPIRGVVLIPVGVFFSFVSSYSSLSLFSFPCLSKFPFNLCNRSLRTSICLQLPFVIIGKCSTKHQI